MKPPVRHCAIYTRKSSEEGLDQDFNSLDAQRESCQAYIASQKAEGWVAIKENYDDGGFSGGNVQRPALQKLLADIKAGKIHIIVVYKIDRLTRSLMDFAKLVEIFDQHQVTFVSVTQSFNTTNSMGRLTLNVLLSFAQFEREVTGERIRDKIAASKKKGMWMGGVPPMGYDLDNHQLLINEENAKIVRHIFERYLVLGCVSSLQKELKRQGYKSAIRLSLKGKPMTYLPFKRAILLTDDFKAVGIETTGSFLLGVKNGNQRGPAYARFDQGKKILIDAPFGDFDELRKQRLLKAIIAVLPA